MVWRQIINSTTTSISFPASFSRFYSFKSSNPYIEGKSVQEMVHEALRHVPNDNGDKNIERCLKLYNERMTKLRIPRSAQSLQDAHENSKTEVMKVFDEQHFGCHHAKKSVVQLDEEIQEAIRVVNMF